MNFNIFDYFLSPSQLFLLIILSHLCPVRAPSDWFLGPFGITPLMFIFISIITNNMITKNGLRIKKHFSLIIFSVLRIVSSGDIW